VNSRYTKQKVEKNNPQLQDNTEVVYPPVNSDITPKPWSKKQDQAIILGRIEPGKRIEEAIEIVEQSRLNLKIVGKSQDTQYIRRLKSRYTNNVEIREDLPWQDVRAEIRNSKIGLNTTGKTENFGISVVEYMKGNCLPLVRGGSGPEEIVPGQKHVYETRTEGGKTGKLGF
jgi:glycosyltransferase involved in cell wall biosynthesis